MEIEALRRQLSEEIAAQFEAKLREAKRQKSQIEEEFEQSSEKWRTERRRLNSEIDRLESALAEARQSGRDFSESRPDIAVDPQEIAKLQAAADERLKEVSQSWEKERARLQAEISRLQEGIAELIERSNNPLRANPNERGKLESKYDDAIRAKRQAEDALLAAKATWEAEKLTLTNEAAKNRQAVAPAGVPRKADDQFDKRLKEAVRLQEELASDLEKARQELSRLKEAHSAELQGLTSRLNATKVEWEAEKASLVNEAAKLRQATAQSAAQAGAPRKEDEQLDKRLQEAIRTRDGLAADLENARQELARLKEAHNAELQNMTARLQAAKTEWEAEKTNLVGEAAKLRQSTALASAPRKGDEQLDKRLQEAIRTRDGIAADLEKSKNEIAKLKETHSAELQDFTGRYIKTRTDLEKQLRESEEARAKLERDLEMAQQASAQAAQAAQADGAQSEEVSRLTRELDEIQEEKKRLVLRLAETSDLVSADVVNDLRQQFEGRIKEILAENTQLTEKVKIANAMVESEGVRVIMADGSGPNGSAVSTLDSSAIDEEVKRVEELSAEIARLIDDPETELATVIRKNVERAALDAYLKGILFSLGRGKKL
jgi:chromosome segregation ATPase